MEVLPHVPKLHFFKPCGATSKRSGLPCSQPAMKNGRCRFHGGKSTGAKTLEGKQAQRQANLKAGLYTKEAIAERQQVRELLNQCKALLDEIEV